jgi:hypothetical protein
MAVKLYENVDGVIAVAMAVPSRKTSYVTADGFDAQFRVAVVVVMLVMVNPARSVLSVVKLANGDELVVIAP